MCDRQKASVLRYAGVGDGNSERGLIALVHLIRPDDGLPPGDNLNAQQQQYKPTPHPLHSAHSLSSAGPSCLLTFQYRFAGNLVRDQQESMANGLQICSARLVSR